MGAWAVLSTAVPFPVSEPDCYMYFLEENLVHLCSVLLEYCAV